MHGLFGAFTLCTVRPIWIAPVALLFAGTAAFAATSSHSPAPKPPTKSQSTPASGDHGNSAAAHSCPKGPHGVHGKCVSAAAHARNHGHGQGGGKGDDANEAPEATEAPEPSEAPESPEARSNTATPSAAPSHTAAPSSSSSSSSSSTSTSSSTTSTATPTPSPATTSSSIPS